MTENIEHSLKPAGDLASVSVVIGTLMQWLPAVAALFTIVWTAIRIYETDTFQRFVMRRKVKQK